MISPPLSKRFLFAFLPVTSLYLREFAEKTSTTQIEDFEEFNNIWLSWD